MRFPFILLPLCSYPPASSEKSSNPMSNFNQRNTIWLSSSSSSSSYCVFLSVLVNLSLSTRTNERIWCSYFQNPNENHYYILLMVIKKSTFIQKTKEDNNLDVSFRFAICPEKLFNFSRGPCAVLCSAVLSLPCHHLLYIIIINISISLRFDAVGTY